MCTVPGPVRRPQTSLQAAVRRLVDDLAKAVLDAVRAASVAELSGMFAPSRDLAPEPAPSARRARMAPRPRSSHPSRGSRAATAAPPRDPRQLEFFADDEALPSAFIVDPGALLGATSRVAPPTSDTTEPIAEALPIAEVMPMAPSLPVRVGEDVLRAAGGGLVLRRRRAAQIA